MPCPSQAEITACPTWCTTAHDLTDPHDSETFSVTDHDEQGSLSCRLTQPAGSAVLVELQDEERVVARLTQQSAIDLSRMLFRLGDW